MYGIRMDRESRLQTNAVLREYARNEYGNESVEWFLAAIKRSERRLVRRSVASRFRLARTRPTPRPVGHKGTPRLPPSDLSSST